MTPLSIAIQYEQYRTKPSVIEKITPSAEDTIYNLSIDLSNTVKPLHVANTPPFPSSTVPSTQTFRPAEGFGSQALQSSTDGVGTGFLNVTVNSAVMIKRLCIKAASKPTTSSNNNITIPPWAIFACPFIPEPSEKSSRTSPRRDSSVMRDSLSDDAVFSSSIVIETGGL